MMWLLASLSLVGITSADYHIGVVVQSIVFEEPMNTLSDGSCCNSSCGMNQECCAGTRCTPAITLCFRESQHPRDDTDSGCPLLQIDRTIASQNLIVLGIDNMAVRRYYTGSFQLYIRISHLQSSDFTPLIDQAFLEFSQLQARPFIDRRMPINQRKIAEGMFNRVTIDVQTSVHCADGWNGTACEVFCNSTCSQVYVPPPPPTPGPPNTTPAVLPLAEETDNNIAIIVGVSVGVAVLVLLLLAIFIAIIVVRKRKWKRTFTPEKNNYVLSPKRTQPIEKADIQVIPSLEPLNRNQLYASINKKKRAIMDDDSDRESPPPVPPYMPDSDDYVHMQATDGVVYQNFAILNKEN